MPSSIAPARVLSSLTATCCAARVYGARPHLLRSIIEHLHLLEKFLSNYLLEFIFSFVSLFKTIASLINLVPVELFRGVQQMVCRVCDHTTYCVLQSCRNLLYSPCQSVSRSERRAHESYHRMNTAVNMHLIRCHAIYRRTKDAAQ